MIGSRKQHLVKGLMLAIGCLAATCGRAQDSTIVFGGADGREKSYYGYLGLLHHVNPDIAGEGALVRVFGLYGEYDYKSAVVPRGDVDADMVAGDVMLGYQWTVDKGVLRGFAGLDYEDHDLSPNNRYDSNRGSDLGVKFQGEFETDYLSQYYAGVIGSYGTAKERYWLRARGGYNFGGYIVGPEGVLTGDQEYDEQRIGAFLMLVNPGWGLSVSTGYSDANDRRGGGSMYGALELSTRF